MIQRTENFITADGSSTLYNPFFDEHYHSINGAIEESLHVYINAGLHFCLKNEINIFEMGFGTGLNALLTMRDAHRFLRKVNYTSVELFPLTESQYKDLNYCTKLDCNQPDLIQLHEIAWGQKVDINEYFSITKREIDICNLTFADQEKFDVIYFDAFSPDKQPELWTAEIFKKIYNQMSIGGVLTTYSSKGLVKQNLRQAGFTESTACRDQKANGIF